MKAVYILAYHTPRKTSTLWDTANSAHSNCEWIKRQGRVFHFCLVCFKHLLFDVSDITTCSHPSQNGELISKKVALEEVNRMLYGTFLFIKVLCDRWLVPSWHVTVQNTACPSQANLLGISALTHTGNEKETNPIIPEMSLLWKMFSCIWTKQIQHRGGLQFGSDDDSQSLIWRTPNLYCHLI